MIEQFELKTKIVLNRGALAMLKEVKGTQALIISDKIIQELGYLDQVTEYLQEAGIRSTVFTDVSPDPDTKVIADGLSIYQTVQPDVLVAIGGGSAIDAAKGIMYAWRMSQKQIKKPYFVAIPSTSGTGSEVTDFSVITAEGEKIVIVDEFLSADLAILDATCIASVPQRVAVDTGMDVLAHATEAYVAKGANDFTDALAEKAISMIFQYLPVLFQDSTNDDARDHVHYASCMAGIAFNHAGLGIVHSLSHAIGGRFHLPHGRCNAVLIEEVIKYNAELAGSADSAAAHRYGKLATLLKLPARTPREGVVSYIDAIQQLKKQLQVEKGFKALGVSEEAFYEALNPMGTAALMDRCTPANPLEPTQEALETIYKNCL